MSTLFFHGVWQIRYTGTVSYRERLENGRSVSRRAREATLFETPPGVNERSREKGARRARWPLVIERDSVQLYLMATFSTVMAEAAAHPGRARHDFQPWKEGGGRGGGGGGGRLMSRWTREERSKGCSEESEEGGWRFISRRWRDLTARRDVKSGERQRGGKFRIGRRSLCGGGEGLFRWLTRNSGSWRSIEGYN